MAYVDAFPPHHRFLYKPFPGCLPADSGGCHIDVFLPKSAGQGKNEVPLAIFIHGGGFMIGSSADIGFNQVKWFSDNGIAVVSLEYRLIPQATLADIRQDLLDGYLWIQTKLNDSIRQARSEGGHGEEGAIVDVSRCVAVGGSAGGTAVICLAIDIESHRMSVDPELPALTCVIPSYPVIDMVNWQIAPASALRKRVANDPERKKLVQDCFEEPVCVSAPYAQHQMKYGNMIPRAVWYAECVRSNTLSTYLNGIEPPTSPSWILTNLLTPAYPPTWLHLAREDTLIPPAQTSMVKHKLDELGVECVLCETDAPHGFTDIPGWGMTESQEKLKMWWEGSILPGLEWAAKKLLV